MKTLFTALLAALILHTTAAQAQVLVYRISFSDAHGINYDSFTGGYFAAPLLGGAGTFLLTSNQGARILTQSDGGGRLFTAVSGEEKKSVIAAQTGSGTAGGAMVALGDINHTLQVQSPIATISIRVAKILTGTALTFLSITLRLPQSFLPNPKTRAKLTTIHCAQRVHYFGGRPMCSTWHHRLHGTAPRRARSAPQARRVSQIIISALSQSFDTIGHGVPRGQQQDVRLVARRAQVPQQGQAVKFRQHHVQHQCVVVVQLCLIKPGFAIRRCVHRKPRVTQGAAHGATNDFRVFHQENTHRSDGAWA